MPDTHRTPAQELNLDTIDATRRTAFRLVETGGSPRKLVILIGILLVASVLFLAIVPWQQTVVGSGKVTSFAPEARPQTIESAISGRIVRWYVREGAHVSKGDTVAILSDINVNFMDTKLLSRLQTLRNRTFDAQEQAINVAIQRRKQAEQRYVASLARLERVIVDNNIARTRFARADTLFKDGLISQREFEAAQARIQEVIADSISSIAGLTSAQQDIDALVAEEERVINHAYVAMQEVDVRIGNAQGRISAGVVLAPLSGTVVRIAKAGAGQTVKEGEELALIVPKTTDQAVEIYVSSMDAAIIEPGRYVSLQFSGFPAFQFSGWRDIHVGIFHGRVKVVDAVDDGTGRFRVLIVPTEDPQYTTWPDDRYLRQGTHATGWVLLDEVTIGYELWRQLMGFPPQFPVSAKEDVKK
ncbi:MAG: HlyD family efflux transporter periplasmic adaptor subunit [bacterium]|nr:HlyD family efflux transporter periplasmic adaptor subunit [bacterium]